MPLAAVSWLAAIALAASPFLARSAEHTAQVWQTEDGLPQNGVTSIVQTRDGYLWVGTYGGLARFDGARFVVFDGGNTSAMHNSRVTSLLESRDGALWIGHETGDLTRFQNGRFEALAIPNHSSRDTIVAIAEDDAGKIWLLNESGLLLRAEDGLALKPEAAANSLASPSLANHARGLTWVARGGPPLALRGGRLEEMGPDFGTASAVAAGRDGGVWVVSEGRARKWRDGRWAEDLGPVPWGQNPVTALRELRNGTLAAGTLAQGIYLLSPGHPPVKLDRSKGLPQDWIRSICEDREGNLWVGAGSGGLTALRPARVSTMNAPDGWQGRSVLSVMQARDGALWIGTEGAGLYRLRNGQWSRFGEREGLANLFVWSLAEDRSGRLWAGTWGSGLRLWEEGRFVGAPGLEGLSTPMPALFSSPDSDDVWLGTGAGLLRYREGESEWFGAEAGLADVRAVTRGTNGVIWFGMAGRGLGRLENGEVRRLCTQDGLASDFIQSLLPDEDGSLWIGTADSGLNRLKDGKFTAVNMSHGLPNNVICHIVDDGLGFFWISTHGGIVRAAKEDLRQCAEGKLPRLPLLVYGLSDGLPTLECSGGLQPAGCRTADGKLWFPTSKGLVRIDPSNISTNPLPPPVLIEEFRVDGSPMEMSGAGRLRIPPGRHHFEFDYAALSFSAPEKVLFRTQLEGLERKWMETGRSRSASYTYLPPGDYTFRVMACNNDGVWNTTGASLAFTALPYFWQTWWFRALSAGSAFASAGLAMLHLARRRLRLQLERAERQQAVERERARIAQDIHDDLGASLTRITMLSQSARADLNDPPQAAADLDRIYSTARELTRSLEEIVWAVNPRHDTLDSLATYLGKFAQDFLAAAGVRCRLDVPVRLPAWPLSAETRHNLFLAFKEALHNVVKHSGASEVKIILALEAKGFSLAIEDNGRGWNAESPSRAGQGNGVPNMRQRLADIGGRCEIADEGGTRVRFFVESAPDAGRREN